MKIIKSEIVGKALDVKLVRRQTNTCVGIHNFSIITKAFADDSSLPSFCWHVGTDALTAFHAYNNTLTDFADLVKQVDRGRNDARGIQET